MEIMVNITSDKKDLVKAGNAVKGFKDVIGTPFKMTGVLIFTKEEINDKSGETETKTVCAIKNESGEFVTSISPTVKSSLEMIVNTYTPEEILAGVDIVIKASKSKSNRDFFFVDLV